jgi:DNA polymerase III delta subunit
MLTILLGPDGFSKKEYVNALAENSKAEVDPSRTEVDPSRKVRAEVEFFYEGDRPPDITNLTEQNLFSKPKISVLVGLFDALNMDSSQIEKLIKSSNQTVFIEEKLDRRKTQNKELLANKLVTVKEFKLPHGRELNAWIQERLGQLGGKMSLDAVEELAIRLGRDEGRETKVGGKVIDVTEIYTLWQAQGEIRKLMDFANGKAITKDDVAQLVPESREVDTLQIVNAIGDHKKQEALELTQVFLRADTSADEKSRIIQLSALLAEQFRSIFMVLGLQREGMPESEILNKTGWKPGRLFMVKKVAARFPEKKVTDLLIKLESLDEELKSANTPPRVLLDLILIQLF